MSFLSNTHARICFIQYVFAFFSGYYSLELFVYHIQTISYQINELLLLELMEKFIHEYKNVLDIVNQLRTTSLDATSRALICAGITELRCGSPHKLIIKEYLKLGDIFEVNSGLINGILAQYISIKQ